MLIIGCDFHTRYQQIAMVDEATGELVERRLRPLGIGLDADAPLGAPPQLSFLPRAPRDSGPCLR